MLWDRKWCDNKFLIGGLMFMVKANFGHSDFKLVCCFPQGKAVLTYIRKYFKTWTESWQFFRSCQLWSCASKWPPHSPLLSVKCCTLLVPALAFFFSIKLKKQKSSSQLQHVCKQVTLSPFPSSFQSFNDRSFQYKCMWNMSFSA